MIGCLLLAVTACSSANVVMGLMSEKTGAVYPAEAKTSILKTKDAYRITLESAIAPEGLSRRVLPREGAAPYVKVDDCVFFSCGGKRFFVNFNGAWCGDRPDGFKSKSSVSNGLWVCASELPAAFCRGGDLTIGRRFAYAGPAYGHDASIKLDPKTFGDPDFLPPIEDASFDRSISPFRQDDSAADRFFCKFAYYPRYHKFRVKCDVTQLPGWQTVAKTVDCTIADAKGRTLLTRAVPVAENGIADETFGVPDLKEHTAKCGNPKYELKLALRGVRGAEYRKNFYRHICEWEGNKYGLSGIVPKPFEPVKREEGRGTREEVVKVVLREHMVDKTTGLWKQVTAAGHDLLARPMAFVSIPQPRNLSTSQLLNLSTLRDSGVGHRRHDGVEADAQTRPLRTDGAGDSDEGERGAALQCLHRRHSPEPLRGDPRRDWLGLERHDGARTERASRRLRAVRLDRRRAEGNRGVWGE